MHQELDGSFTAMQFARDLDQLSLRSIMQIDRLSGTGPELLQTPGQIPDHIVGICPQGIGGKHRFQLKTQFCPRHFLSPLDVADMFSKQIASDSQQPRADQRRGIESSLTQIEPQEDFLHHIVGIARLLQPGTKIAVYGTLIPFDDQRERCPVSATELLDQRLIRHVRQNSFPIVSAGTTSNSPAAKIVRRIWSHWQPVWTVRMS